MDELSELGENNVHQPILDKGIAVSVAREPTTPIAVNAVSDGEDLRDDVSEGEAVLCASEFHPPPASTEDYLAVVPTKKRPPAYCLPLNTPLCDWKYFGACPTGLIPEPCRMDSTNCHKYAHRICVDAWETKYRMPEHSNGNFCQAHHPMIEQLESMDPDDKDAVALKEYVVAVRKLNFETNDEDNDNAKLATSQGHNAVDEDQSATSKEVDCSGLLKTPPPRITKDRTNPSLSSSGGAK